MQLLPRLCARTKSLSAEIRKRWPEAPEITLLDEVFAGPAGIKSAPFHHEDADPVTIIYTSGTSGEPKGVVLNAGNVNLMLGCTNGRLHQLMEGHPEFEQVFHYTPFCFAASWIAMLTFLSRDSVADTLDRFGEALRRIEARRSRLFPERADASRTSPRESDGEHPEARSDHVRDFWLARRRHIFRAGVGKVRLRTGSAGRSPASSCSRRSARVSGRT